MSDYELIMIGNYDGIKKRSNNINSEEIYYSILVERCNTLMDNIELFERIVFGFYSEEDETNFFNTFYGIMPYEHKQNLKFRNISSESIMLDYLYYQKYALSELKSDLALLNAIAEKNLNNQLNFSNARDNVKKFLLKRDNK